MTRVTMIWHRTILVAVAFLLGTPLFWSSPASGQTKSKALPQVKVPSSFVESLNWRSIGPANMSGRITALTVYEKNPRTWWAASASGGLLKTVNNGVTFEHQFDDQATVSIGDVQVFQGDPNILWVGTGEANPRNSSSWGDGVYKSTDGGKTWKNMGLPKIFQTGRIALHPTDKNIAYVGALGRLWGPNEERGVFKTTDGGKTWKKVLYIDENTGVVDLQMHPTDPNTLLAAGYERRRDGFDGNDPMTKFGEKAGLYKTTDGGKTWKRITKGLPDCKIGRVGLCYYRKDPKQVYMVLESEMIGKQPDDFPYMGVRGEDATDAGAKLTTITARSPAAVAGLKTNDIVLKMGTDVVSGYNDLLAKVRRYVAGDELKLEVLRDRKLITLKIKLGKSPAAAGNQRRSSRFTQNSPFAASLGGQRENMQDQQGKKGYQYGGVYHSKDGGDSWVRINSVNPRPMYYSQIRVDPSDNRYIFVLGTSLYRSKDGGKTFTGDGVRGEVHVDNHAMWVDPSEGNHIILGNDGGLYVTYDRCDNWDHHNHIAIGQFYHVGVGPRRNYRVYGGLQDNGSWGGPTRVNNARGPENSDWFRVGGGDGFICLVDREDPDQIYYESQNGAMGRVNLRTGQRGSIRPQPPRGQRYRFNWKTPFILSPHNSRIHYSAGNHVFQSVNRGTGVKAISPDITLTSRGSGSAISESPLEAGVLYAGTTDGSVVGSKDNGKTWTNLFTGEPWQPRATSSSRTRRPTRSSSRRTSRPATSAKPAAKPAASKKDPPSASPSDKSLSQDPPLVGLQLIAYRPQETVTDPGAKQQAKKTEQKTEPKKGAQEKAAAEAKEADIKAAAAKGKLAGMAKQIEALQKAIVDLSAENSKLRQAEAAQKKAAEAKLKQAKAQLEAAVKAEKELVAKAREAVKVAAEKAAAAEQQAKLAKQAMAKQAAALKAASQKTATTKPKAEAKKQSPLAGTWNGRFTSGNFPASRARFVVIITEKDGKLSGEYRSTQARGEASNIKFDKSSGSLSLTINTGRSQLEFAGTVTDGTWKGRISVGGNFRINFEATLGEGGEFPPGKKLKELVPGPRWVSSLEASRFRRGRCYMTLDGHRSNDDATYVFVSEDYGMTWRSLTVNLPKNSGSARVIREDVRNANLLYLGCEFGLWFSVDRGETWTKFTGNFPTVAVHEVAVHPTAGEIVAGTHGRSLWVLDVTMLRQLNATTMAESAALFAPADAIRWQSKATRGSSGTRRFKGTNPLSGAEIFYHLKQPARTATLKVLDVLGETVAELTTETTRGLHRVVWNLRGSGGNRRGTVRNGQYAVVLTVNGKEYRQTVQVVADPDAPSDAFTEDEAELQEALQGVDEEEEGESDAKSETQAIR